MLVCKYQFNLILIIALTSEHELEDQTVVGEKVVGVSLEACNVRFHSSGDSILVVVTSPYCLCFYMVLLVAF